MREPGDSLFIIGIGLVLLATWTIIPFIIVGQLSAIRVSLKRILANAEFQSKQLQAVEKNTGSVAKFFNEKDVRIEQ